MVIVEGEPEGLEFDLVQGSAAPILERQLPAEAP